MKISGHGKSKIITEEERLEIKKHLLFKYQVFFDIMFYTGCRISECCNLRFIDIAENTIVFRKSTTKGKRATREIFVPNSLIEDINKLPQENSYLFPGRFSSGHITRYTADDHLRNACKKANLIGISSHSYRRTVITSLHKNLVPIKVIMKISGHSHLNAVSHYIDTDEVEVLEALKTRW